MPSRVLTVPFRLRAFLRVLFAFHPLPPSSITARTAVAISWTRDCYTALLARAARRDPAYATAPANVA